MRVQGHKARIERLEAEKTHAERMLEVEQSEIAEADEWLKERAEWDPLHEDLQQKKQELAAQLFGLLPVFPTLQETMRVVNFEVPMTEAYHLMDMDECAAITGYFVKLSALLGRYLEVALPNKLSLEQHRWMIQARCSPSTGQPIPPVPLHPRVAGVEAYRVGLVLLQQNVVRLCFDQGIAVRSGHEHEIAQNLHRLVTYVSTTGAKIGLGWDGPYHGRVTLPEEKFLEDDDFFMVDRGDRQGD